MQRNNNNGSGTSFTPVPNSLNPNGLSHGQTVSASGPPLAGLGRFDPQGPISSSVPDGPVTKRQLAEQLINLIQNAVQPESWKSLGGQGTIDFFNGNGDTLVISQTPEIQEDIKGLLTALRKMQEVQVAIEVRVIMVGEQFYETMNMNWSVGINNSSSSSPQISISPFGNPNAGLTNVVNGFTQAGALAPGLSIPSGGGAFSMPPFLGALPGSLATSGGMSLGLAFLSDIQVKMLLEAATGDKRTQELHSPKLTVLDCHTASIAVVKQQMYMTGVSLQQVGAMVQVVPQNNPYPTGITMQVTPVVSPDRHFVRLHLVPKLTSLIDDKKIMMVSVPVPQIFEGPGSGTPLMMQMPFQQPSFEFKEINTTVNVPDGATVILGGLKSVSEVRDEKGVPVLNQIPILGRLFRNQNYARETEMPSDHGDAAHHHQRGRGNKLHKPAAGQERPLKSLALKLDSPEFSSSYWRASAEFLRIQLQKPRIVPPVCKPRPPFSDRSFGSQLSREEVAGADDLLPFAELIEYVIGSRRQILGQHDGISPGSTCRWRKPTLR